VDGKKKPGAPRLGVLSHRGRLAPHAPTFTLRLGRPDRGHGGILEPKSSALHRFFTGNGTGGPSQSDPCTIDSAQRGARQPLRFGGGGQLLGRKKKAHPGDPTRKGPFLRKKWGPGTGGNGWTGDARKGRVIQVQQTGFIGKNAKKALCLTKKKGVPPRERKKKNNGHGNPGGKITPERGAWFVAFSHKTHQRGLWVGALGRQRGQKPHMVSRQKKRDLGARRCGFFCLIWGDERAFSGHKKTGPSNRGRAGRSDFGEECPTPFEQTKQGQNLKPVGHDGYAKGFLPAALLPRQGRNRYPLQKVSK